MTWRANTDGFTVAEVPITFTERELGVSKMSGSNIREALVKVAKWGVESRRNGARAVRATNRSSSDVLASAAPLRPDQVEALLEQLFEFFDGAPFQQHVPVRAGWL